MKCCNDIYPSLDLVRWSVCQSMDIKSPDMSDYYNKEETDELLDGKLDVSAYTPTDLEDYYTKEEIDAGFDSVNDELANKLDASAYTPTDLSQYWTSAETAAVIEDNEYVISQAINELKDTKQDALVSGENIKTINGISLVGEGNIEIGSGGTTDLSNYYTKSETNDLLDDKADLSGLTSHVNNTHIHVTSQDKYNWNNKLDATAYTPTDLSGYWTSGETQEAINAATSGIPSSATIEGLRSDLNALSGDVYTNYYSKSQVDALIAALQAQIDDLSDCCSGGSGDTGSTEGKKYVLHSGDTEYSMDCNSSSTLSSDDLIFHSGTSIRASAVTDVVIGDCVDTIGSMAFDYFTTMTSVTIPSGVTTIENQAFKHCESLPILALPEKVSGGVVVDGDITTIPSYMCYANYDLYSTNIPQGVTTIETLAYYDCLSLMNIVIPSTVTTIGDNAFRVQDWASSDPTKYQKKMAIATGRTVSILATTPPTLGLGVFGIQTGSSDIATYPIYVPAASVNAYKTAWPQYANRIFAIS